MFLSRKIYRRIFVEDQNCVLFTRVESPYNAWEIKVIWSSVPQNILLLMTKYRQKKECELEYQVPFAETPLEVPDINQKWICDSIFVTFLQKPKKKRLIGSEIEL